MQLKDLFKPDQFGNVPIYRDTDGFIIYKSTAIPDVYEYKSGEDRRQGTATYFTDETEVFETSREDKVLIYVQNVEHPVAFYKVHGVLATAENVLLARVLEKSK
ncbi:hypothetical protein VBApiPXC38_50 [Acinetobacter phage VB_ApiP_XC38]|uniref:Uncharacterized protein n=1 Tax=Acinetobacter phage VB_ApiP_XC38 TaxID=2655002 RepID=A0A5P8PR16_9CAUD|nr:hypothetical protein KNU81_gp50 [Acinetobacter phage VB_ApiP_XC38]QFR59737.1 hypothetical protein VBApiPXC38_50 [Acinetobacter phage VB_ApiP_XC38]